MQGLRYQASDPSHSFTSPLADVEKIEADYLAKLRRQTPVWTAFDTVATAKGPETNRYIR